MLLLDSEPPLKYSAVFLNINITAQPDMAAEQFLTSFSVGIDLFSGYLSRWSSSFVTCQMCPLKAF